MPTLVPGYRYDIFVSYRHNDNRGAWVTEFVKALQDELAATIKDPISIYFDKDTHEGLRETHEIKDSLDGKLNAFIFIPILSQTYCDPRGYAFTNEFLPFHKNANNDSFGLKIKTTGGNVTNRILPIRIHDLDDSDSQTLKSILGGPIRGIDFIYAGAGVSRPLKSVEEDARSNLNKTFYHDQINKVARAVKELLLAANRGDEQQTTTSSKVIASPVTAKRSGARLAVIFGAILVLALAYYFFSRNTVSDQRGAMKSIAVLPFENMNKDSTQDYFSNGIAEDILNHLAAVATINVKSRTSTLQYKGSEKSATIIGEELNVDHILEGSVRRVGDKVRIVVQLIDTQKDVHVWSKTYDRDLKDVLAIQSEVSISVARELEATLSNREISQLKKVSSSAPRAYDLYLQAREIYNGNPDEGTSYIAHYEKGLSLLQRAINIDPFFSEAYALKAQMWIVLNVNGVPNALDSVFFLSAKAIELDSLSPEGYIAKGQMLDDLNKTKDAMSLLKTAIKIAPGNASLLRMYGTLLLTHYDSSGANMLVRAIENNFSKQDPNYYYEMGYLYMWFDLAASEKLLRKALNMDSSMVWIYFDIASIRQEQENYQASIDALREYEPKWTFNYYWTIIWSLYANGDYEECIRVCLRWKAEMEKEGTNTISYQSALASAYLKSGQTKKGESMIKQTLSYGEGLLANNVASGGTTSHIHYEVAACLAYLGKHKEALQHLNTAVTIGRVWSWGLRHNPQFDSLRSNPEFKKVLAKLDARKGFREKYLKKALKEFGTDKRLASIIH